MVTEGQELSMLPSSMGAVTVLAGVVSLVRPEVRRALAVTALRAFGSSKNTRKKRTM